MKADSGMKADSAIPIMTMATSTARKNTNPTKPGDGQVYPTARSFGLCRPNLNTNRFSLHSEVPPGSILGIHSQIGFLRKPSTEPKNHKPGPAAGTLFRQDRTAKLNE
jgi:hypothetical protein